MASAGRKQIPLLMEPVQDKAPKVLKLNHKQPKTSRSGSEDNARTGLHFKSLSLKRVIFELFVSDSKRTGVNQSVINLNDRNRFIPDKHYKMDVFHCLKFLLQNKEHYMCKIDLKDAYVRHSVFLLNRDSRKLLRFLWAANFYEFMCLCFG